MKTAIFWIIAFVLSASAFAQSTATMFGVVDMAYTHGSAGSASRERLQSGGLSSNRIGFRGVEDLGGGMSAGFWLESGFNDDGSGSSSNTNNQRNGSTTSGDMTFNRRSTLSLSGRWGELRLGRDFTAAYNNQAWFDPFGNNGVGTSQVINSGLAGAKSVTGYRASNMIGYLFPSNLGGFYGQVQHFLGENVKGTATSKDGSGNSLRVGYEAGPLNVAFAGGRTYYASGNISVLSVGGSYDLKVATLVGHYNKEELDAAPRVEGRGYVFGGLVPVGAGVVRIAYSTYRTDAAGHPQSNKFAIGYVHNLSRRTALYVTYALVRSRGGADSVLNGVPVVVNKSSNGHDIGIRHAF